MPSPVTRLRIANDRRRAHRQPRTPEELYRERRVRPASEGSSGRDQELTSEAQSPLDHAQLPKEDGDRDPERDHRRENEEAAVREPYWLPLSPQSRLRIRR